MTPVRRPVVLIEASSDDLHATALERRIAQRHRDVRVVRFDTATYPGGSTLTLRLDAAGPWASLRVCQPLPDPAGTGAWRLLEGRREAAAELDVRDVRSVWHRRPRRPILSPDLSEDLVRRFAEDNVREHLQSVHVDPWAGIAQVHDQLTEARAHNKWVQLVSARRQGLAVPETLATTDAAQVRAFAEQCWGRGQEIIYKPVAASRGAYQSAQLLTRASLSHLATLAHCPVIFQRRVRGRDLRVVIVGRATFGFEQQRTDGADGHVDVRQVETRAEAVEIPQIVSASLVAMCRELGVALCSADLILDADGRPWFLDLNPNGQWLWLELESGVPISAAVADLLATGRADPIGPDEVIPPLTDDDLGRRPTWEEMLADATPVTVES